MNLIQIRIIKILLNFGLSPDDFNFNHLVNEGIAMHELGYSFKQIERILEEKIE